MRSSYLLGVAAPLLALACATSSHAPPSAPPATSAPSTPNAPPTAPPAPSAPPPPNASAPPSQASLPFIEDDYARALSEARASHRLLFVDAWAPWCHTCLSMKAFTFRDPKILARAGDVVWTAVDTEKPENAAWVAAHPMHAWPTFFVVDPVKDKTVLEWPSSATADELVRLLEVAGESANPHGVLAKAETLSLKGNAAAAEGDADGAIAAWRESLAAAPDGWPGRAATLESLLDRLFAKKSYAPCVETADRELPRVPRGGARAATIALMCAEKLPAGEARRPLLDKAVTRAHALAVDENEPMLADDRSALYEEIVGAFEEDKRDAEVKSTAGEWATFLDAQAAKAPDPTAREVFDAHRLDAYLALGTPERAIPVLDATARDFPNDYNPPARLARAYLAMRRYADALAAIDRGLALVYGPRALRLYATKADILEAKGDRAAAAAALRGGLAKVGAGLPSRYAPLAQDLSARAQALETKAPR